MPTTAAARKLNIFYMAAPNYGGWVSYTAHAMWCWSAHMQTRLFKLSSSATEAKLRDFGYGTSYQNVSIGLARKMEDRFISAIDAAHYSYLPAMRGSGLILHDPTELKPGLVAELPHFKMYASRASIYNILRNEYKLDVTYLQHPFYQYPQVDPPAARTGAIAVSRVDFDKHTKIILEANALSHSKVQIYGAVNRIYVHHSLGGLDFDRYYHGTFPKDFTVVGKQLRKARFMVDMSAIKRDGSGVQYTFLEAIHAGAILVLNREWFVNGTDALIPDVNCIAVADAKELAEVLDSPAGQYAEYAERAKEILKVHAYKDGVDL